MKCNILMKMLFEGNMASEELTESEKHHIDELINDVVFENGCLFMKTKNGCDANIENFRNKTEFEAWNNEILINSEFPESRITAAFALGFFEEFGARLMMICPERMCSIMSEDNGRYTYRFHIVRKGEPLWISEDLEKYAQPIMYKIFGGAPREW